MTIRKFSIQSHFHTVTSFARSQWCDCRGGRLYIHSQPMVNALVCTGTLVNLKVTSYVVSATTHVHFQKLYESLFWLDSHAQLERSRNPLHLEDIALPGRHSPTFSYDIPKLNIPIYHRVIIKYWHG